MTPEKKETNNSEENGNKGSYKKIGFIVFIVVIIIILGIFLAGMEDTTEPDWTIVKSVNGEIRINSSDIDDGKLHYYKTESSDLGFFILKNSNGQVMTRISICEPCEGESFKLANSGKELVCNACGTKWSTKDFDGISGGCVDDPPPPLYHYEDSGHIVISEGDIRL
jgi:uncharacterized membrane protein